MSTNLENAIKALQVLSYAELQQLVPTYNSMIKTRRTIASVAKVQSTGGFNYGDILRWTSNKRGRPLHQYMKFEKYNRAVTCVVGKECDKDGKPIPPTPGKSGQWTVAISFIDQVNGKTIGQA